MQFVQPCIQHLQHYIKIIIITTPLCLHYYVSAVTYTNKDFQLYKSNLFSTKYIICRFSNKSILYASKNLKVNVRKKCLIIPSSSRNPAMQAFIISVKEKKRESIEIPRA